MVELLSPAGNLEKLKIAFNYGADAVYGGVSHFSLRVRSGKEFDEHSFKEGIDYAHSLGKKVYVTINGFPFNNQIKLYENHMAKMRDLHPDAFIISSPGLIKMARDIAPNMPIHLSTQANVMNYLDASVYYDMGVERIIVAREISLKDCEQIKKKLPDLELEAFVHGSMCFAYSGRCLISAMQMGRVPNRGSCANDCRFEYTLYAANEEHGTLFKIEEQPKEGTYIYNAKDMNLSAHIDEILQSGVIDSLKIEGRTKSPYYAAITAKAYREAIDDFYAGKYNAQKYVDELNTTKNRGFTDAYLVQRPYQKHNTQNLQTAISDGSHQVVGLVDESGESFLCKYKLYPNDKIEIVTPHNTVIEERENEFIKITQEDGKFFMQMKKIVGVSSKEYDSIHSGNTDPVQLGLHLPAFTLFRTKE
ncbi:MAG: peptidase U32 family protein [Campylobacterota bacterium]